jgi:hypothetical protein
VSARKEHTQFTRDFTHDVLQGLHTCSALVCEGISLKSKKVETRDLLAHQWVMRLAIALLFAAIAALGQVNTSGEKPQRFTDPDIRLWKWSATALIGASALDVASSWGRCCESNRLLASPDRRFGSRGLAVKSGVVGGQLALQYLVARKSPKVARVLGFVNFAGAGAVTAVAFHNYRVPQRP